MPSQGDKLRELVAEQAAEWYAAQADGSLTPTQSRNFMAWLRASPIHVEEYLAIEKRAADLGEVVRAAGGSVCELWQLANVERITPAVSRWTQGAAATTQRPSDVSRPRVVHVSRRKQVAMQVAAVAVIAIVIAATTAWFKTRTTMPFVETVTTQKAEERTVTLPDKTSVRLDAASAITVRFDGARREVTVDRGQAYFKVIKDAGRPFSVLAGPIVVRDIGTEFDVSRSATGTATVAVAKGKVAVWLRPASGAQPATGSDVSWGAGRSAHGKLLAQLGRGEQVQVARSGRVLSHGSARFGDALAWARDRIVFDGTSVAKAAAELNRHNDKQIVLIGRRVGAIKINGTIGSHDVPTFVDFLNRQRGVRTVTRGNQIFVYDAADGAPANMQGERLN